MVPLDHSTPPPGRRHRWRRGRPPAAERANRRGRPHPACSTIE
ncbi:hypothetical protein APASM_2741 [Actinosynnema pretiosum subsp. pretiosum]|nr:hypothetical protein APASM_2741 [Actinosynnema pretiosum subsp. pretiosum]